MTETSFADQIAKNAQVSAQAEAPFGAAIGISKSVAETAFKTEASHEIAEINLEIARRKIEQVGAGTAVVEIAGKCIDGIGTNLEKFSKWHKGRAEGRLAKSKKQRATIESIQGEKIVKLQNEEEQRILQAQVEQFNPQYRVGKAESWYQRKIGSKIDALTSFFKENVSKKYNEMRVVANESDAKKFTNRAEVFGRGAHVCKETAEKLKSIIRSSRVNADRQGVQEEVRAENAEITADNRADTAIRALSRTRQADYFMPAAKATSESIQAQGGDADYSRTADAAKEWAGRAAGTNATT